MRIRDIDKRPFHRVRYLNAGRKGRVVSSVLEIFRARVDALPEGVDAIIVASDLQGVVPPGWRSREGALLGVELACEMRALAEDGELPYPERTGVVLAGDLYSAPAANKRGATGDVRAVWLAWAEHHRWVCGVQGNHDLFGDTKKDRVRFEQTDDVHLLDGDVRELDGIRFGGVGEIIGDPKKKGRKSEVAFLGGLERVTGAQPDILVLHQGPDASRRQRGDERVRHVLEENPPSLTICGHVHWEDPLAETPFGQVLNVDARAVVLSV